MDHLAQPISVARMAEAARMSPRSYVRHFARAVGTAPSAYRRTFRGRTAERPHI